MALIPISTPSIPVGLGEMVYVALKHVMDYVDEHGTYPPGLGENMRKVLNRYDRDRTASLVMRGIPGQAIQTYTEVATQRLEQWIAEKAARTPEAQDDFNKWTQELQDGT